MVNVINENALQNDSCHAIPTINGKPMIVTYGQSWHGGGTVVDSLFSKENLLEIRPDMACEYSHVGAGIIVDGVAHDISGVLGLVMDFDGHKIVHPDGFPARDSRPIFQPEEHLDMFELALKKFDAKLTSVGYLFGGTRFFVSAELGRTDIVPGDPVLNFVNLVDDYIGRHALQMGANDHRIVCKNTAQAAMSSGQKWAKIKHTKNAKTRFNEILQSLLDWSNAYEIRNEKLKSFSQCQLDSKEVIDYVNSVLDATADKMNIAETTETVDSVIQSEFDSVEKYASAVKKMAKKIERRENLRDSILNRFESETCSGSSLWSIYNAITEEATHGGRINDGQYSADRQIWRPLDKTNRLNELSQNAFAIAVQTISA